MADTASKRLMEPLTTYIDAAADLAFPAHPEAAPGQLRLALIPDPEGGIMTTAARSNYRMMIPDLSPFPNMLAAKTILTAGLVAGALDLTLAITWFTIAGDPLATVPHAIASGWLGARAFHGGAPDALLGIALHFLIALVVAAIYYMLSRAFKLLNHQPILSGVVYGLAVFLVMQNIVVPHSAEPRLQPSMAWLITDLASHVFFVGITISLITRRFALRAGKLRPDRVGPVML